MYILKPENIEKFKIEFLKNNKLRLTINEEFVEVYYLLIIDEDPQVIEEEKKKYQNPNN